MPRHLNLRQIEAFKAVMENGTVSRGAEMLNISQPAMSKLIAHLEMDSGLKLFDRVNGRLAPTGDAMRLLDEVERIFAGVRQVESAVEAIRREGQGQLSVGVMPALAGAFIQRAIGAFRKDRPNVFCSIQSLNSQLIADRLVQRKLDIGLVSARIVNPYVTLEPLIEHPMVCILPRDDVLASKNIIKASDLNNVPFISYNADTFTGHRIAETFKALDVVPNVVVVANIASTICEFVAAGMGISLVHPLMISGFEHRVCVRPFDPAITFKFQLCRTPDNRNAQLVEAFARQLRTTAAQISNSLLSQA